MRGTTVEDVREVGSWGEDTRLCAAEWCQSLRLDRLDSDTL